MENKTPIHKLIDYMESCGTDESAEQFRSKLMAKAVGLLHEEKELLKAFYLKGDLNGCGCYDHETDEDAEDYFNETFGRLPKVAKGVSVEKCSCGAIGVTTRHGIDQCEECGKPV